MKNSLFKTTTSYSILPEDMTRDNISPFLTDKEVMNFSLTSHGFFQIMQSHVCWVDKFIMLGVDKELIQDVISYQVIEDYSRLYRSLITISRSNKLLNPDSYLLPKNIKKITLWEILCLSGSDKAVIFAINNKLIDNNTRNELKQSPLHLIALSGKIVAIDFLVTLPGWDLTAKDQFGRNVLHNAGLSGSSSAVETIAKLLPKQELAQTDFGGHNVFHLAAYSGSPAAMMAASRIKGKITIAVDSKNRSVVHLAALSGSANAIDTCAEFKEINLHYFDPWHGSMLHCATMSGSAKAMRKAKSYLPKQFHTQTLALGENVLHLAAQSGSVSAVEEALNIKGLYYERKDFKDNVIHFAARSGDANTIKYVKKIPQLNLSAKDKDGNSALHVIAASAKSDDAMYEIVNIPGMEVNAKNRFGDTPFHKAIYSGNLIAIDFFINLSNINLAVNSEAYHSYDSFRGNISIPGADTILHMAVMSKKPEVVIHIRKLIATLNLNINVDTHNGSLETPSDLARRKNSIPELLAALTIPLENLEEKATSSIHPTLS